MFSSPRWTACHCSILIGCQFSRSILNRIILSILDTINNALGKQDKVVEQIRAVENNSICLSKSVRFWISFLMFVDGPSFVIRCGHYSGSITSSLPRTLLGLVIAFLLAATVTQPLFGAFSGMFGRRLVLIIALVRFLVGSILCARSTYMGMFIGSRVVCSIYPSNIT